MVDPAYAAAQGALWLVERLGRAQQRSPTVVVEPTATLGWLADLGELTSEIRDEYVRLRTRFRPASSAKVNPLSVGVQGKWSLIPLVDREGPYPWLVDCPVTSQALSRVPVLRAADFAVLAPRSRIAPHCGHNWGVLRGHLPLVVPEGDAPCALRFPDDHISVTWEAGVGFAFDDTYRHEAVNLSDSERVVLLIEFDRNLAGPLAHLNRASQRLYRWHPVQRGVRERILSAHPGKDPPGSSGAHLRVVEP